MKTLIIYDELGYIISTIQGQPSPRKPIGVPLEVEIPEGKHIVGVDVSVTPHEVILENIPPTELDEVKNRLADLTELVLMGGM